MNRILVADDDQLLREAFRAALEVDGYAVCEAASTEEALRLVAERDFDVVLSDVYMPGNGLDLLRRLRRMSPELSVVLITGFDRPADEAEAMGLGAFAYLRKPLSLYQLRETIRGALAAADAG
jgi:DNA-binding NtrC family response regulator